jgi:hypothetical protein
MRDKMKTRTLEATTVPGGGSSGELASVGRTGYCPFLELNTQLLSLSFSGNLASQGSTDEDREERKSK